MKRRLGFLIGSLSAAVVTCSVAAVASQRPAATPLYRPLNIPNGNVGAFIGPGPGAPNRNCEFALLSRLDVVAALRVTPAECSRIEALVAAEEASVKEELAAVRGQNSQPGIVVHSLPGEDPAAFRQRADAITQAAEAGSRARADREAEQSRPILRRHVAAARGLLTAVLSHEQRVRLGELDLQYRGAGALADKDVAVDFGLSPDQFRQIANALTEYRNADGAIARRIWEGVPIARPVRGTITDSAGHHLFVAPEPQPDPRDAERDRQYSRELARQRVILSAKVLAILTPAQRATWERLVGKPFQFRDDAFVEPPARPERQITPH